MSNKIPSNRLNYQNPIIPSIVGVVKELGSEIRFLDGRKVNVPTTQSQVNRDCKLLAEIKTHIPFANTSSPTHVSAVDQLQSPSESLKTTTERDVDRPSVASTQQGPKIQQESTGLLQAKQKLKNMAKDLKLYLSKKQIAIEQKNQFIKDTPSLDEPIEELDRASAYLNPDYADRERNGPVDMHGDPFARFPWGANGKQESNN